MDRVKEMQNKFYCEREFPFNGLTRLQSRHSSHRILRFVAVVVVSRSNNVWLWHRHICVFEESQRMQVNWLYRLFENCDIHMITGEFLESFHAEISLAFYFQQIIHLRRFSCYCRVALVIVFLYLFIRFIVFVLVCYLWKQSHNQIISRIQWTSNEHSE